MIPRNQKILKQLHEAYYLNNIAPKDAYMSSYWEDLSGGYKIKTAPNGDIVSLSGSGVVGMDLKNPVSILLNFLSYFIYLIILPDRFGIMRPFRKSFKVSKRMGLAFSFNCFRQVCSLALITRHMGNAAKNKNPAFVIIGDGYGFLSSLIKETFPGARLILIDIGKTLIFQAFYCQKAHPDIPHALAGEDENRNLPGFVYCPAERIEKLGNFNFDVAINIVSMQEMTNATVKRYFDFLRLHANKNNLFYCCNRESKTLPDGEVLEIKKYAWIRNDKFLIDEYCPWYKFFFSLKPAIKGPKIFGIRVPFISYFAGEIIHRLAVLAPQG
jgi:hypothetical protein